MQIVRFNEIASISAGKNRSRMSADELDHLYTIDDMDIALVSGEEENIDTIMMHVLTLKTSPLLEKDKTKAIQANYLRCELNDINMIDPWYLIYQLNEGSYIRKEIDKLKQGTEALIKKINISDVAQLEIPYLPIEKQRRIGKLYRDGIRLQYLLKHQADLTHEAIMKVLEDAANDTQKINNKQTAILKK